MEKTVRFTSNAWKFYNDQSETVKVDPSDVWILSGYVKKTQKAPLVEINKAKKIKRAVGKGA